MMNNQEKINSFRMQQHKIALKEGPERARLLEIIRELTHKDKNHKINCWRVILHEEGIHLIAGETIRLLARDDVSPDAICGKAAGGIPIAIGTSLFRRAMRINAFSRAKNDEARQLIKHILPTLHTLVVRNEQKKYETQLVLEGKDNLSLGNSVAIIDDIASSGKSLVNMINIVEESGFTVIWVGCLIDQSEGARQALETKGHILRSFYTIKEIRDGA